VPAAPSPPPRSRFLIAAHDIASFQSAAKTAGRFDSAWTNQHPGGWDPLTVLATLDGGPPELGTAVVLTYPRHPVVMATEAVTLQALTGGRLTLGIGPSQELAMTGWLGIPYESPVRHTREYARGGLLAPSP
jgi:5,10-methylenetetrahydromethanopterin reductase